MMKDYDETIQACDDAIAFINALNNLAEQQSRLQQQRDALIADMVERFSPLLPALARSDRDEIFSILYWHHATQLSVAELCKIFGAKTLHAFTIKPIGSGVRCKSCATEMLARSWNHLSEVQTYAICEACQAKKRANARIGFSERDQQYRKRLAEIKAMSYQEYLRTPEWQAIRKRALQAAKYKCQLCGTQNHRLHVHHNTYTPRTEERNSDLLALCPPCHAKHHDRA